LQETAYAACDAARSLAGCLTGCSGLAGCADGRLRGGLVGGGLDAGGYMPAGDASGDAQADAESTADGVGFHSVYDGSSDSLLPPGGDGSKVDRNPAPLHALVSRAGRRPWRYP
jgi:hypothetical protein